MPTRSFILSLVASLTASLVCTASVASASQRVEIVGEATDLATNRLVYREIHLIDSNRHTVSYRDTQNNLIADKMIQYTKGYSTPEFTLNDYRFKRRYGSTWKDTSWSLWEEDEHKTRKEKVIAPDRNLVIDAGFNGYILDHYDSLQQGNAINFEFAITNPPMAIAMKMQPVSCQRSFFQELPGLTLCLKITARHSWVSWFIPDIYLAFRGKPPLPELALYQGPSNLDSEADTSQNVRILYHYEENVL